MPPRAAQRRARCRGCTQSTRPVAVRAVRGRGRDYRRSGSEDNSSEERGLRRHLFQRTVQLVDAPRLPSRARVSANGTRRGAVAQAALDGEGAGAARSAEGGGGGHICLRPKRLSLRLSPRLLRRHSLPQPQIQPAHLRRARTRSRLRARRRARPRVRACRRRRRGEWRVRTFSIRPYNGSLLRREPRRWPD
jgi:hypothetical protein